MDILDYGTYWQNIWKIPVRLFLLFSMMLLKIMHLPRCDTSSLMNMNRSVANTQRAAPLRINKWKITWNIKQLRAHFHGYWNILWSLGMLCSKSREFLLMYQHRYIWTNIHLLYTCTRTITYTISLKHSWSTHGHTYRRPKTHTRTYVPIQPDNQYNLSVYK